MPRPIPILVAVLPQDAHPQTLKNASIWLGIASQMRAERT